MHACVRRLVWVALVCAVAGCGKPAAQSGTDGACALPSFPDETCTGVPAGTALRRVPGDVNSGTGWAWNDADQALYVTSANVVLDGLDVPGQILVQAPGVTVKRSRAQGIFVSGDARNTANARLIVEDTEVACLDADGSTAIGDMNFTASRVNIHGCENGFDVDSDATIQDSFVHDLHQSELAHTDSLQSAVGANLLIEHNRIYADTPGACGTASGHTDNCGGNSALIFPGEATATNTLIQDNEFAGGAYTVFCPSTTATSNFRVINNHWSRLFHANGGAYGPQTNCVDGTPLVNEWSGNVWDDTGDPVQ